ncbi:MAG: hypothetical protein Q9198_009497 [Flavoplaca austrocitrina]
MGAWGYGLLESDAELDVVDEIEDEVAKIAKTKRFRLLHPKHPARVKERLDGGVFHRAFLYFHEKKWNHGMIYLVVMAMRLGSTIPADDLAQVTQTLKETPMYKEAKEQLELGLAGYKNNGEPWDFQSKSIVDAANASITNEQPAAPGGFQMLNVMEKWSFRPQGGPNDMKKGMEEMLKHQKEREAKQAKDPKPATEPKPKFDLPQEHKDRLEAAVKAWFNFQMAPE